MLLYTSYEIAVEACSAVEYLASDLVLVTGKLRCIR